MLTLEDIYRLACEHVPRAARWHALLSLGAHHHGPAHEIGHALVATPGERRVYGYGLHGFRACTCPDRYCLVAERAAMRVARALLLAAGETRLALAQEDETSHVEVLDHADVMRRSWRLVRERKLWPLPRTVAGLERLLRTRLA